MSINANPESAYLWLDCDAFRGEAGAERPDLTGLELDTFSPAEMDAFGGIEAGFAITADGAATPKRVMNYRQAPYKVQREPKTDTIVMRSVDNSKARIDTLTQGGRILEFPDGTVQIEAGTAEEFSLLLVLRDGEDADAYWSDRVTLSTPPAEGGMNGTDLAGSEFSLIALSPLKKIFGKRPAALSEADVELVDATGAPLVEPTP